MGDVQNYTATVGGNTNVFVRKNGSAAEQQSELAKLAMNKPGDISLSSSNSLVHTGKSKLLALFENFYKENNVDVSTNKLMNLGNVGKSAFTDESHESAMKFATRFSETDVNKMSFSELMTFMLMVTYSSESERRNVLSEVRSAQSDIAMKTAVLEWGMKREAAMKDYYASVTEGAGKIASGAISIGMAVVAPIVSNVGAPKGTKNNNEVVKPGNNNDPISGDKNSTETKTKIIIEEKAKEKEKCTEEINKNDEEIRNLKTQVEENNKKILPEAKDRIEAHKETIDGFDSNIEKSKKDLINKRAELGEKRREMGDNSRRRSEILGESKLPNAEEKKIQGEAKGLEDKRIELQKDCNALKAEIKTLETDIKNFEAGKKDCQRNYESLCKSKSDILESNQETDLQKKNKELQDKISSLELSNERLKTNKSKLENEIKNLGEPQESANKVSVQSAEAAESAGKIKPVVQNTDSEKAGIESAKEAPKSTVANAVRGFFCNPEAGKYLGEMIGGITSIIAAKDTRSANFIRAELSLLDAFKTGQHSFSQGVNESISSSIQNMNKIADELKQVISALAETKMCITRNI